MNRSTTYFSPPSCPAPQTVTDLLHRAEAFTALRAGVEQIAGLQNDLRILLPDYLRAHVEPSFIKTGTLTLFTAHNALAARLRQIEPRLLAELQQRGWPVSQLKVRVRPQAAPEPSRIKAARMTTAGAAALHQLAASLDPSPLQMALARMAERYAKVPQ